MRQSLVASRKAVLLGAGDFPSDSRLAALEGPANDIAAMADVLGAPDIGEFTIVAARHDVDSGEALAVLEGALNTALRSDLILLYYSGHGVLDKSGRLYLAASNTRRDLLRATAISLNAIQEMVQESPAGAILLILDCCFSGAVEKSFLRGSVDDRIALFGSSGRHVLSCSTAVEVAVEREGEDGRGVMGLFTRALVEGLRTGQADLDGDGFVSLADAHEYTSYVLRGQQPQLWSFRASGQVIVGRVPSGEDAAALPDIVALRRHVDRRIQEFRMELRRSRSRPGTLRFRLRSRVPMFATVAAVLLLLALSSAGGWWLSGFLGEPRSAYAVGLGAVCMIGLCRGGLWAGHEFGVIGSVERVAADAIDALGERTVRHRLVLAKGWQRLAGMLDRGHEVEKALDQQLIDQGQRLAVLKRATEVLHIDYQQVLTAHNKHDKEAREWEEHSMRSIKAGREDLAKRAVILKQSNERLAQEAGILADSARKHYERASKEVLRLSEGIKKLRAQSRKIDTLQRRFGIAGGDTAELLQELEGAKLAALTLAAAEFDPSIDDVEAEESGEAKGVPIGSPVEDELNRLRDLVLGSDSPPTPEEGT